MCSFATITYDAVKKSLHPPYDGPYAVLRRSPKYFALDVQGNKTVVSVDRLKAAHFSDWILFFSVFSFQVFFPFCTLTPFHCLHVL